MNLSRNDDKLIEDMREALTFQLEVFKKREKLVYAISSNVQYLSKLHKKQAAELRAVKSDNRQLAERSLNLSKENAELNKLMGRMKQVEEDNEAATQKILGLMKDTDEAKSTIEE